MHPHVSRIFLQMQRHPFFLSQMKGKDTAEWLYFKSKLNLEEVFGDDGAEAVVSMKVCGSLSTAAPF